MSSSSSKIVSSLVSKLMRRKNKNKNNNQIHNLSSPTVLVSGNDNRSGKEANVVRSFTQMVNANIGLITLGTGANAFNNPTASASFIGASTTNVTSDPMFAQSFRLADLPQYASWTALFDQYRISRISVSFIPSRAPTALASTTTDVAQPALQFWYAVDLDDSTVVSPLTALMQYENVRCHTFDGTKPMTVSFKPHIAVAAYSGAFTSYANQSSQWIDCGSPDVLHYGLKYGFPCLNSTSASIPYLSIVCTYYVEFKSVR
jgi:hypothetical protein